MIRAYCRHFRRKRSPTASNDASVIDAARRVVRGVDEHRPGLATDGVLDGVDVQLEIRATCHRLQHSPVIVDVEPVLHEVGPRDDDFIPGIENGLEDAVEGPSGAAGHHDVPRRYPHALVLGEVLGHRLARFRIAGVGHVAVKAGGRIAHQLFDHPLELRRWLQVGVADAEVEDPVTSVDLGKPRSFFEHLPDPRRAL